MNINRNSRDVFPNGDKYPDRPDLTITTLRVRNPYSVGSPRWRAYNRALRDLGRCFVVVGGALFEGGSEEGRAS